MCPSAAPTAKLQCRKGPDTGIAQKTEVLHYFSLSKQLLTWGETLKCTPRAKGKGNQVPQAELCLGFSAPSTFGLSPEEIIVQFSELFSLQAWLKLITQLSLSCLSPAALSSRSGHRARIAALLEINLQLSLPGQHRNMKSNKQGIQETAPLLQVI